MDPTLKSKTISKLKEGVSSFSPRMQVVAKYILDNPADFGLDYVRDTARKAGVSTFTLVRLAEKIGFDSFEEFREPFRHALVSTTELQERPNWIDGLYEKGEAGQVQAEAALNTLSNTQRSLERQTPELLDEIVTLLLSANTTFVTAVRASYSMAFYFHYVGRMALPSLELIPRHMGSAVDELTRAKPGDAVIAITLTPYSRETVEACKFAQERGAKLILITDSDIISPGLKPDFLLTVSSNSTHHFACYSGAIAVLEALLSLLMKRGGVDAAERITSYEEARIAQNAYVTIAKKQ
ncbi:MurR/RpiR family transcriptional regulator [Roseobacter sp. SK209-2-6]|uniref:MurR/RpiR family transcriptional regulator n=1 Tax=Roseobacter sp. SK209-2-6 TaxID=388739 RepID=UPI0003147C8E|nr:MurR/RpiR family transcriptional regulator [Roseobacter sp. SK209-2-6]